MGQNDDVRLHCDECAQATRPRCLDSADLQKRSAHVAMGSIYSIAHDNGG
jgi:hypothetical protein